MHHGRPLRQVGAKPHPGGVRHPHAAGDDVGQHRRELVNGANLDVDAAGKCRSRTAPISATATGPSEVQHTLGRTLKIPSRFIA